MRRRSLQGVYAVVLVCACVYLRELVEGFATLQTRLGGWTPAAFGAAAAVAIALALPASLVHLLAGAFFGFALGTAVDFVGAFVGSLAAFFFARGVGRSFVERWRRRNPRIVAIDDALARRPSLGVWLRLSPSFPLAAVNYSFGVAGMSARTFVLTAPAMIPPMMLYVGAGAFLRDAISGGPRPWWEWAFLGLGAFGVAASVAVIGRVVGRALLREGPLPGEGGLLHGSEDISPPILDAGDHPRRVGVEIELAGLPVATVADCVAAHFDGEVVREHDYEFDVETELGTFRVELDSLAFKRMAADAEAGIEPAFGSQMMRGLAEEFVPSEIVTPPLPFDRLSDLDGLVRALREKGGLGSSDKLVYSFGVHFNPEAPSLEAANILAHLRAFVLLSAYLRKAGETDLTRRVLPHITPHPPEYLARILNPNYDPDLATLIDDYLEFSPTRNRDLDLLPLFAHLDEERVRRAVGEAHKVNSRPTYHYRLPNSQVGDPSWSVTSEWRSWLMVERLANDPARLRDWMVAYRARPGEWLDDILFPWADEVEERVREPAAS